MPKTLTVATEAEQKAGKAALARRYGRKPEPEQGAAKPKRRGKRDKAEADETDHSGAAVTTIEDAGLPPVQEDIGQAMGQTEENTNEGDALSDILG